MKTTSSTPMQDPAADYVTLDARALPYPLVNVPSGTDPITALTIVDVMLPLLRQVESLTAAAHATAAHSTLTVRELAPLLGLVASLASVCQHLLTRYVAETD